MNFGFSPNDTAYMLIGGLSLLFVVPLLVFLITQVGRLFAWVARIRHDGFLLGWWLFWMVAIVAGLSLYMDYGTQHVEGIVTSKSQSVEVRRQGDWRTRFNTTLEYPYAGENSYVSLRIDEAHYDALQQGGTTALNVAPLYGSIALVRLASLTTAEWLATPLRWLAIIAVVVILFVLAERIKSKWAWIGIVTVGVLAAILIPSYLTYRAWQESEDLPSRPLRAEATVTSVRRITNIDYFPCDGDCSDSMDTAFDVPLQYDIVQMTYVPTGRSEAVLATDSVDVGSYLTYVGETIPIAYAEANPRDAQILGATRNHHWRNVIFFVWTFLATLFLLLAARFVFHWMLNYFNEKYLSGIAR